jgi:hypothetical protein
MPGGVPAAAREPGLRLVDEPRLLSRLLALELLDLALDRREELATGSELALDRRLLGRLIGNDALLLGAGLREFGLTLLDLRSEMLELDAPRKISRADWSSEV